MSKVIEIGVDFETHHDPVHGDGDHAPKNVIEVGVFDESDHERYCGQKQIEEIDMTAEDIKTALTTYYPDRVVAGSVENGNAVTLNDLREKWAAKAGLQHEPLTSYKDPNATGLSVLRSDPKIPTKLKDGDLVGYHGAFAFVHDAETGGQRTVPLDEISEKQLEKFESGRDPVALAF